MSPQFFFGDLKPHAKFQNHKTTPSGRKVTQGEREIKTPLIVDAEFRAAHTDRLDQQNKSLDGPQIFLQVFLQIFLQIFLTDM